MVTNVTVFPANSPNLKALYSCEGYIWFKSCFPIFRLLRSERTRESSISKQSRRLGLWTGLVRPGPAQPGQPWRFSNDNFAGTTIARWPKIWPNIVSILNCDLYYYYYYYYYSILVSARYTKTKYMGSSPRSKTTVKFRNRKKT